MYLLKKTLDLTIRVCQKRARASLQRRIVKIAVWFLSAGSTDRNDKVLNLQINKEAFGREAEIHFINIDMQVFVNIYEHTYTFVTDWRKAKKILDQTKRE